MASDEAYAVRLQLEEMDAANREAGDERLAALTQAQEYRAQAAQQAQAAATEVPGPRARVSWQQRGARSGRDGTRTGSAAASIPPLQRAMWLRHELKWHSGVDAVACLAMLMPLGPVALACLVSPAAGVLSARLADRRAALLHALLAAGNVVVRAVYSPVATPNFLYAATGVALALPAFHVFWLASRWFRLLWCPPPPLTATCSLASLHHALLVYA